LGWWVAIKQTVNGFNEDRLMTEAAGVTFYTLLALFPALASLISLYGLFADAGTIRDQLQMVQGVIPDGGLDIIRQQVEALTAHGQQALGLGLIVGLLVSLWSANSGVKSLFDALNVVYHEREARSFVRRTLVSFCFTLGAIIFLIVSLISIVIVPIVFDDLGLASDLPIILAVLRWPLMLITLTLFFSLIYRFGPSRNRVKWRWVSWGSAFASVAWVIVSLAFSYYVANFGSYNKTYGSLGAAIGFMTWIWISAMVVLLGGELNAELERQAGCRQ
jgi:membrane protein